MRCFLGIPIPKELRKKIYEVSKDMQMEGIKLVKSENLHWTVKFLGNLSEERVTEVKKIMNSVEGKELEIEIKGIGTFPSPSYVKVVWIGVGKGKEEFTLLLKELNKKFSGIGRNSDVVPHVTVGRVKFIRDKKKLFEKIDKTRGIKIGKMKINKLVLYESQLNPGGPVYKEIKKMEW